jgi:hypothetical protein
MQRVHAAVSGLPAFCKNFRKSGITKGQFLVSVMGVRLNGRTCRITLRTFSDSATNQSYIPGFRSAQTSVFADQV